MKKATPKKEKPKSTPLIKFERMFNDIGLNVEKREQCNFYGNQSSTWIVSDNNSSFKSIVEYGQLERHIK